MSTDKITFDKSPTVMNHPAGLFILFFTEMWERFSYYGMRALLVLFLVSAVGLGGWDWTRAEALGLYATYTGLVYITPIFGGLIADRFLGYKMAIAIGALLMTLGHASMALETEMTFYVGLGLLIVGNGFFKPNISSVVSGLYKGQEHKKDAGFTIFYMGINAGAFLGILLCGYVGEKVGWSYGFGLAGIFMFLGMLQFWFAKSMFGTIGDKPVKEDEDTILVEDESGDEHIEHVSPEQKAIITRDRLTVIFVLAFFTIFFWMAFEQAGGSMTVFAKDYTDRILTGTAAASFTIINTIMVLVPLAILTWVLMLLFKATFKKVALSNLFLGTSFIIIWGIVLWMVNKDFNTKSYLIDVNNVEATIRTDANISVDNTIYVVDVDKQGTYLMKGKDNIESVDEEIRAIAVPATVKMVKDKELEVPASWFGILNSLFIIIFAPLFSKLWESRYNPSAPTKFALGLILLGLGFGVLAYGASSIPLGAKTASVSMIWLMLAYFLHTMGELTLSPVGLSYVSKLSPPKLLSMMFGLWFTATAVANYLAGLMGSFIDKIADEKGLSFFFLIFTAVPIIAGLILIVIRKWMIKKMHGIE
ncbi:MAG TPA: MFS transporter [Crocinitomix sp.]|nr:MFS transporter [Crocinitomix sp.]